MNIMKTSAAWPDWCQIIRGNVCLKAGEMDFITKQN